MKGIDESRIAVVGGGPAGVMAAEVLSARGARVTVYDRMPSLGRKFLMAGRGGLNLTHSEPFEPFLSRYGAAAERLRPYLEAFPPAALVAWAEELGQPTFTGSSGRIFPKAMKASPLLRAWIARLADQGVRFELRAEWLGFEADGALRFHDREPVRVDAVVLALGGASWPRLGATGGWAGILAGEGIEVAPFEPSNVGVNVPWSDHFRGRFAGAPLKPLALTFGRKIIRGEAMVTRYGLEGGAIYALSAALRDAAARDGQAVLELDLHPNLTAEQLAARLARPRRGQTAANFLRKAAGLSPVAVNLIREAHGGALPDDLAVAIKRLRLTVTGVQGLERAISSAGGVAWDEVDEHLMLRKRPGVFVAGEMLDWEAPTGGYLLQACFATGVAAAEGVLARLNPRG